MLHFIPQFPFAFRLFLGTMFLVEKRSFHLFPLFSSSPSGENLSLTAASSSHFDDALAARLRSLVPPADSKISLSWLSRAVRVIALTLSDAVEHLLTSGDAAVLAGHLDSGATLLDACNAVAAEIDRLLRRRLLLRFALHLLSSDDSSGCGPSRDRLRRARDAISEWQRLPSRAITPDAAEIVQFLAPAELPSRIGEVSVARRAIYAVETVSSLVVGAVIAVLGGGHLVRVRVPPEFSWAAEYEKVLAAVSEEVNEELAVEMEEVEAAVKRLTDVIDAANDDGGVSTERLGKAVEEAEKVTAEMTVALERLSNDVNGLFRAALNTRNTELHRFRVGPR